MTQTPAIRQDTPARHGATAAIPDLAALKNRQQLAWSSGDYAIVGTTLQIVGEQLCEALDIRAGRSSSTWPPATGMSAWPPRIAGATSFRRTMFRACWSAVARAIGRRPDHRIQGGRRRGVAFRRWHVRRRRLDLRRDVHAQSELSRVRTPARLQIRRKDRSRKLDAGRLYRTRVQDAGQIYAASRRRKITALWGRARRLTEMFGLAAISIEAEPRNFNFRYRSADHFLDVFKTYYGPMLRRSQL